jgi:CHAD domain-containing protein
MEHASDPVAPERGPVDSLLGTLLVSLAAAAALRRSEDDEAIHTARQKLKQVRALLRLLRPALGRRIYRFANREVRDAGRPLRQVRDAAVLLRTLDSVKPPGDGGPARPIIAQLHRQLVLNCRTERDALSHRQLDAVGTRLDQVAEILRNECTRVADLKAIPQGMKMVYRQGRAAYRIARRHPTTASLHEWRKQVKYLHNELQVLHGLYGTGLRKARRRSKQLAAVLGDDHDLALLRLKLQALDPRKRFFGSVLARIRRSRRELQHEAFGLGKHLFGGSPHYFAGKARRSLRRHLPT